MTLTHSHGREFVEQVCPILEQRDVDALVRHLQEFWPAESLKELLACGHEDAACAALVGLSFVGTMQDCPAIAPLLHDDDGLTADLAEHALWSIWFRSCNPDCTAGLAKVVKLIDRCDLDEAQGIINRVLALQPDFAEAHHQHSVILFLRTDYDAAATEAKATLLLNPWHFGAMAVLGHCYAASNRLEEACRAYQRALQVHPRLQGVRQAIRQIRAATPPDSVNTFTKL